MDPNSLFKGFRQSVRSHLHRICLSAGFVILSSPAYAAAPARGLDTLPTNRPITMGYVNALRSATGSEVVYTPAQIVTEVAGINWQGFDAVIHAFAEPLADGTVGEGLANFSAYQAALVTEAHSRNKSVILSIGGAYPARLENQFAAIAKSAALRQTFSQNVVAYLQAKGYDGVDIDWEFPQYWDGGREHFTLLMQTLHAAVKAANPNYIVMFGTGPGWNMGSYDFAVLSPHTDFFFYFGYDWKNQANGPMTKPNSVQWTTANDTLPEASVKGGIQYVLNKGFPASKIICGLPFYGSNNRSWSAVRNTWAANQTAYLNAIDPNSMEVSIGGEWFSTPDCLKKKMDALLKPTTSVLTNKATIRGVGTWEIGHEHRSNPDLSTAYAQWIAAYTGNPLLPTVSIADASVSEGNTGNTMLSFTVTLSSSSQTPVTVNYVTADVTASSGSDYAPASGVLTFAAGETTKTISISVPGDTIVEPNETFTLTLSGSVNATLGRSGATGTILNDDTAPALPRLSIAGVTLPEGNAGSSNANLTVSLSTASTATVTVNYATSNGTATAGSDYTDTAGTVSFAPGETSKVISVVIQGDTIVESDETFIVTLSSPVNATIATAGATVRITNDDSNTPVLPTLSIAGTTVPEGNAGSSNANLTVSLSSASSTTVTASYATANGTATAGSDYTAKSASVSFAPGETSKLISIAISGDTTVEPDETFTVTLSTPVNATLLTASATVKISNDDTASNTVLEVGDPGWTRHYNQSASVEITPVVPSGGSMWSSGFSGLFIVKNNGTAPIPVWKLEFDAAWTTTGSGNAGSWVIASGHHTVKNPTWMGYSIGAGATMRLDFTGNGIWSAPTNILFNGNPLSSGDPSAVTFATWGATFGITDPNGDPDADGIINIAEFLGGTHPKASNGAPLQFQIADLSVNSVTQPYFTARVPVQYHSKDVEYRVEFSENMIQWQAGTGIMPFHSASQPAADGILEAVWRSAQPVTDPNKPFYARLAAREVGAVTKPIEPEKPVVQTGAPNVPSLSVQKDWSDNRGYKITWNTWAGADVTSWKIYENGVVAYSGNITGSAPQNVAIDVDEDRFNSYTFIAEVSNSVGSTSSSAVTYLAGDASPIAITELDPVRQVLHSRVNLGVTNFTLVGKAPFTVAVNHPSVLAASVNGQTLQVNGLAEGRSGVKITDASGNVRHFGLRIGAPGSRAELPDYLSVGSVSEDENDLKFWSDFQPGLKNKWVDYRYLYMNGGVKRRGVGWRVQDTVDGIRLIKFVRNSLKFGMIPVITWYNIPDGGESYTTDRDHIQDRDYMQGYFEDLKFAIDIANREAGDEKVVWVLEPDFIGYMAQNSENPATLMAQTVAAYDMGVLTAADPQFPNTMQGLIKSINYTIKKYSHNASIGWQFNLWAFPAGGWVPGSQVGIKGLMRVTDGRGITAGREVVRNEGLAVADYYMSAGILEHGADFISIDKYGLDGGSELKNSNPVESTWFWNAEHWGNYLVYIKALHERTGKPVVLWQLPVGHINHSLFEDPYHPGQAFPPLTNMDKSFEDSTPDFFLGNTFAPGAGNRYQYFSQNRGNDPKIIVHGDNQTITWNPHMEEVRDAGGTILLFGDGTGNSTRGRGDGNTDGFWWISQAQEYFVNPVPLNP